MGKARTRFGLRVLSGLGIILALASAAPAAAQVLGGLPVGGGLGQALPALPDLRRPLDEVGRAPGAAEGLARSALTDLRQAAARRLVREHRDLVDVDDRGEPVVRGEVSLLAPSPENLAAAQQAGFAVLRDETEAELGLRIVTLAPPRGLSVRDAVRRLRRLDPAGQYDFNHIYLPSGAGLASLAPVAEIATSAAAGRGVRIGMVDGGVAAHPSLVGAAIEQRGFAPGGVKPTAHGLAVASLLAGRDGGFRGAAPGAHLLVADVYGVSPTGGSALLIAQALGWLVQARTPVISISLVGPSDNVLKAAVQALLARGVLLVAPVGNDGPAAPPLYPASYPGVVSVTGIDARRRVLPEAGRGSHVDFAAPGADMVGAAPGGGYAPLRGTSFAAPLVAGRLAQLGGPAPDPASAARAVAALAGEAVDLGAPGPDPVYGRGLVAFDLRTAPEALHAGHPPRH